jgi:hypothetical protein
MFGFGKKRDESRVNRGDIVEASDAYRRNIQENYPEGTGVFDPFVVKKVKIGPVYDKNANGYHIGGWINEDVIYDDRGVGHRASDLKKRGGSGDA